MKTLRMLIVEDDQNLLERLKRLYRERFVAQGFEAPTIETAANVEEARGLAKAAKAKPYDLVSLDVNLGDQELTGLDILDTFRRFRSAWMIALLTGVETDATLSQSLGSKAALDLKRTLRKRAYERFPAERLLVVEKPAPSLEGKDAETLLGNRIEQIALVYEEVGRLRYIFRPIKVVSLERVSGTKSRQSADRFIETESLHWQLRFNCGDIRTLPNRTGLRTLHHLLAMARSESLPAEQALMIEPRVEKSSAPVVGGDPVADYFKAQGVDWESLTMKEQDQLVRAALSLQFKRYVELRGYQDEDDLSADEEDELNKIKGELGPLLHAAETAYERFTRGPEANTATESVSAQAQQGLHAPGGIYTQEKGRKGLDSPAAANFRKRMERTRDYLRENGFGDLAEHLENYLSSTGANWSYHPPDGIEWTLR